MKCPKCQADNSETAKFCQECGQKLECTCPQCGHPVLSTARFCEECGQNLATPSKALPKEPTFDEKLAKIQKYLPSGLTEKILSQRDRIEGERKQVTVLFTDMAGFTPLTEKLDPEEAYNLMDQIYEILIHKVTEYGGTVNELTGDGIMALFGAPIALEDAPQRAIRASLAIHREMVQFNERMRRDKPGLPVLRMRAGVHTGPVVVGTLGNDLRVDFKAVGDTVNLASRIEQIAEPGATYISEDTFSLTEGLFRFEGLGEKEIKGKEKPIRVYRVIAPSTSRTRFDVSAERGLTPFVGRERESELLLDAFERARSGRGQAVSIVSEAGMGKSRILYEFRKAVINEDVTFLEGKCLSFGRGVAYQPISDILKSNFDIREGDWDSVIRKKVIEGLQTIGVEPEPAMPYLLELLSANDSGIEKIQLSPEGRKDRTIETLKKIVLKGSELRPLVIAIEDLHWIDKTSEDVLKYFLESIPGDRVLLIFTYRTEYIPTWGARTYHNQILLNRLSNRESLLMISNLLGTSDVESVLEELILEKAEGIPFFIEELIKSLKDLKFIERKDSTYCISNTLQAIRIPSTIRDIIMARVDALPEGAKKVLQIGSLIEREFSYRLIKEVVQSSEQDLLRHLSALKDSELLYERGLFPDSTFVFKHALTREVVVDSLLAKNKKQLHEEIGKAFEKTFTNNPEQHYAVLASHFIESENFTKGAEYSRLATQRAEKAGSMYDSMVHSRNRVTCLERMPQTKEVRQKVIDARSRLALMMSTNIGRMADAGELVLPIIEEAKEISSKKLGRIYVTLAQYFHYVEEDYPRAFQAFEEALRTAEEVQDLLAIYSAHSDYAFALAQDCQFERAAFHFETVINFQVALGNLSLISAIKTSYANALFVNGKIGRCLEITSEALDAAKESRDVWSIGLAHVVRGLANLGRGSVEEAKSHLLQAASFCEKGGLASWNAQTSINLADAYYEAGEFPQAEVKYRQGCAILESLRMMPSFSSLAKLGAIKARVMAGDESVDLGLINTIATNNKAKFCEGQVYRYMGEILLNLAEQHLPESERWIEKATRSDKRNNMMFELARAYALHAEYLRRTKGDRLKTQEKFGRAIDIFRECGADGWVTKYEEELAVL